MTDDNDPLAVDPSPTDYPAKMPISMSAKISYCDGIRPRPGKTRYVSMILFFSCMVLTPVLAAAAGSLAFEKTKMEWLVAPGASETKIVFHFQNNGSKAVEIGRVEAPCSCVEATFKESKMRYRSGEKGELLVNLKTGNLFGTVEKVIWIWLKGDSPDRPSHRLSMQMTIPELITIDPKSVTWQSGESAVAKTCDITMHPNSPVNITHTQISDPAFSATLTPVEPGRRYVLTVTPKETKKPSFASITLTTDSKVARQRTVTAYAAVKP